MTRPSSLLLAAAVLLCAASLRAQDDPLNEDVRGASSVPAVHNGPAVGVYTMTAGKAATTSDWHLLDKLPYDAPSHIHFFRYQRYLLSKGLAGLDKSAWDALDVKTQEAKLKAAEALLRSRFKEISAEDPLDAADKELVDAVWGVEMGAGLEKLSKARATKDPEQVKLAQKAVAALSQKLGNIKGLDAKKLFDNAVAGKDDEELPKIKDFLAPEKTAGRFPAGLSSPEVQTPLKSAAAFAQFLESHNVPKEALPGLVAMYQVHAKATGDEKAQMAHIMPTVVRFLLDHHEIGMAPEDDGGVLGMAVPDDYGNPKKVLVFPACAKADPVLVGDTLSHEFEHVYDFYAGRPYTLDSELRGFKTDVLYMRALKKASPEKYAQMERSANDDTRAAMDDAAGLEKAYTAGPDAFATTVAYGHHYNRYAQGTFSGRLPLREAADPNFGIARQLAGFRQLLRDEEATAADQQKIYDAASKDQAAHPTQQTSAALQIAAKDLASTQQRVTSFRYQISIMEVQLGGLQAEARWMQNERPSDSYDLSLPVDQAFTDGVPSRGASK